MVLISFTNIVVDQFNYASRNPFLRYIFFLSHMHADHYQGLSNSWDYGPIYCSAITKRLLLHKFPKLKDVRELSLDQSHLITLNQEGQINCQVYLFDSNHCAGSVMFLFKGYFGTIMHTGDMRFNQHMINHNKILFPDYMNGNSIPIDEVIFDNTYCDPIFAFPERSKALQMMIALIQQQQGKRVFICVDSIGKQQIFLFLAIKFKTLIIVNQERYQNIRLMGLDIRCFSTIREDGWIEVIRKTQRNQKMKEGSCISVTLTGWANINFTYSSDFKNYIIPYSLHSNFKELQLFMKVVRPGRIFPVVKQNRKSQKINNIQQFTAYVNTLHFLKQRGLEFFQQKYVDKGRLTQQYKKFSQSIQSQKEIRKLLKLDIDKSQASLLNKSIFQTSNSIRPSRLRKTQSQGLLKPSKPNRIKDGGQFKSQLQDIRRSLKQKQILKKQNQQIVVIADQPKARRKLPKPTQSIFQLLRQKIQDNNID